GIGADGRASLVSTLGNPDVSLILRGGADGPNWETPHVRAAAQALEDRGLVPRLIVDASHGHSGKDHRRQAEVAAQLAEQVAGAQRGEGHARPEGLALGQSVTDKCMDWETTAEQLSGHARGARRRRTALAGDRGA